MKKSKSDKNQFSFESLKKYELKSDQKKKVKGGTDIITTEDLGDL